MNGALKAGHIIAMILGVISLADGAAAIGGGLPPVLAAVSVIVGVMLPVLAYLAWNHRNRAAWAFEIAICGVFGAITIFGAPKTAHLMGVPIALTLIVPVIYLTAMTLLATNGEPYREGASHK